jgi:NitT/TauT family transport system permease protein
MSFRYYSVATRSVKNRFNLWDGIALILIAAVFILIKNTVGYMDSPITPSIHKHIILDYTNLPVYILRSLTRILLALLVSIIFSIIYALIAAKNEYLRKPMIALLDIMQSIPILGYISFTISGFIALAPNQMLGYELAVIFTVFTCQVWNITYSIYQSLITIPDDIKNTETIFDLNPIQKFCLVEFPYAIPPLIWNIMISISNAWFFAVASEAIIEGSTSFFLPGVGSYIASAIAQENLNAIYYAVFCLGLVIFLYDRFLFRPLIDWSQKFQYDFNQKNRDNLNSWHHKLFINSKILQLIYYPFKNIYHYLISYPLILGERHSHKLYVNHKATRSETLTKAGYYSLIAVITAISAWKILDFLYHEVTLQEIHKAFYYGLVTTIRIITVMVITVIIWFPISIYIGFRAKLARIAQPIALALASFPANLIFPLCVFAIQKYNLNPNIWLSILFIISIQWYIVFNVIGGAASFPEKLKEVIANFNLKGFAMTRKVLFPAILPNFLLGSITAWGSAWNTTVIAEVAQWGNTTLEATGIGAYVANASTTGDMPKVILGILVMLFYIEIFNKIFWRPLFNYADKMEQFK